MTSNARERLAGIVAKAVIGRTATSGAEVAASEILAALPSIIGGMVPDLEWRHIDRFTAISGDYRITKAPFEHSWSLKFHEEVIPHNGMPVPVLMTMAQAHHRDQCCATILKALGMKEGE